MIMGLEEVKIVVMVVDSSIVGIVMRSITETNDIGVMIVSETLDGFGGGMVIVPKGMYGGGEGCRGIYEV